MFCDHQCVKNIYHGLLPLRAYLLGVLEITHRPFRFPTSSFQDHMRCTPLRVPDHYTSACKRMLWAWWLIKKEIPNLLGRSTNFFVLTSDRILQFKIPYKKNLQHLGLPQHMGEVIYQKRERLLQLEEIKESPFYNYRMWNIQICLIKGIF